MNSISQTNIVEVQHAIRTVEAVAVILERTNPAEDVTIKALRESARFLRGTVDAAAQQHAARVMRGL